MISSFYRMLKASAKDDIIIIGLKKLIIILLDNHCIQRALNFSRPAEIFYPTKIKPQTFFKACGFPIRKHYLLFSVNYFFVSII